MLCLRASLLANGDATIKWDADYRCLDTNKAHLTSETACLYPGTDYLHLCSSAVTFTVFTAIKMMYAITPIALTRLFATITMSTIATLPLMAIIPSCSALRFLCLHLCFILMYHFITISGPYCTYAISPLTDPVCPNGKAFISRYWQPGSLQSMISCSITV